MTKEWTWPGTLADPAKRVYRASCGCGYTVDGGTAHGHYQCHKASALLQSYSKPHGAASAHYRKGAAEALASKEGEAK